MKKSTVFDCIFLLLFAVAIRLVIGLAFPGMVFFDEVYQTLEPAHYLAFGTGIMPWEYYLGIRSWLVPMIFSPLMQLGAIFSNDPDYVQLPIKIFLAGISAITVLVGYGFGRRYYDRATAWAIALALALWSEQIYFATHPLTEIIATPFLLWALFLADGLRAKSPEPPLKRRYFYVGLLLGLVFVLRFHLAPALLLAAIWILQSGGFRNLWSRFIPLAMGGLLVVSGAAILDWVTLGTPLQSVWLNIVVNIIDGISSGFGTSPPWDVFDLVWRYWFFTLPLMFFLFGMGWRRNPMLGIVALVIVTTHALIPHKEPRFIFPAITILTILAAFGMMECKNKYAAKFMPNLSQPMRLALFTAFLLFVSLSMVMMVNFSGKNSLWYNGRFFNRLFATLSAESKPLCGLALDAKITFFMTPGQSGLSPSIRLYIPKDELSLRKHSAAYNGILSDKDLDFAELGYDRKYCLSTRSTRDRIIKSFPPPDPVCFYQRPGICEPSQGPIHKDGLVDIIGIKPERWRFGQRDLMLRLGLELPTR